MVDVFDLIERHVPYTKHPKANELLHWLDEAPGRTQSIAVGIYVKRELWTCGLWHCKGTLEINCGPVFIVFGG